MLPGPSSWSTIFDDELSLRRSSSSYHFALNNKLGLELCHTRGSNILSLHHSFDLMSSPIDYIFMKSLDKCVVIIIRILSSSKISIEITRRNTILSLDDLCYLSTILLPSAQHKHVRVLCYTLSSLLSSIWSSLPWSITISYVKNVMRITPPLKNSWYGDTSHPHHSFLVPVLFLTGIPTIELWGVNSKLLATLLLWSNGRVSF